MYRDRSYFAQKEAGRNNTVKLVSNDKLIQISLDKEETSWFLSKTTTPNKAAKLDKGKGKIVEDSDIANNDKIMASETRAREEDVKYYDKGNRGDGDNSKEL